MSDNRGDEKYMDYFNSLSKEEQQAQLSAASSMPLSELRKAIPENTDSAEPSVESFEKQIMRLKAELKSAEADVVILNGKVSDYLFKQDDLCNQIGFANVQRKKQQKEIRKLKAENEKLKHNAKVMGAFIGDGLNGLSEALK